MSTLKTFTVTSTVSIIRDHDVISIVSIIRDHDVISIVSIIRDHDGWSGHSHGHHHHGGRGRGSYRSRGRGGFNSAEHGNQARFKKSYSEEVREKVDILYNKKFKFVDEYSQWKLPELSNWFDVSDEDSPQVPALLEIKRQLVEMKCQLDDVDLGCWSRHTHFTNRSGIVVPALRRDFEPEMCTQVGVV